MANISAATLGTKLSVLKKENPVGPQPTLVPTTYRQLPNTRLKMKLALVSLWLGLRAFVGFIVHIPNLVFFNSPCGLVQTSWSFLS